MPISIAGRWIKRLLVVKKRHFPVRLPSCHDRTRCCINVFFRDLHAISARALSSDPFQGIVSIHLIRGRSDTG